MSNKFGPALPPHLLKKRQEAAAKKQEVYLLIINNQDDDRDDFMPQLPPSKETAAEIEKQTLRREIEDRTSTDKKGVDGGKKKTVAREDWMTQLPELNDHSKLPIGPTQSRTFLRKGTDIVTDRSEWTSVPGEDAEDVKKTVERRLATLAPKKKDTGPRAPSLMDAHLEVLAKDHVPEARVAFDRDRDIGISRKTDSKRKRDMLNDAKGLDSKFSRAT
jgi:hypothetical protein